MERRVGSGNGYRRRATVTLVSHGCLDSLLAIDNLEIGQCTVRTHWASGSDAEGAMCSEDSDVSPVDAGFPSWSCRRSATRARVGGSRRSRILEVRLLCGLNPHSVYSKRQMICVRRRRQVPFGSWELTTNTRMENRSLECRSGAGTRTALVRASTQLRVIAALAARRGELLNAGQAQAAGHAPPPGIMGRLAAPRQNNYESPCCAEG